MYEYVPVTVKCRKTTSIDIVSIISASLAFTGWPPRPPRTYVTAAARVVFTSAGPEDVKDTQPAVYVH